MSKIDVADLASQELPRATFPAPRDESFRFYMAPEVHRGVQDHAKKDSSVEICGVLVGQWGRDEAGPFALATDYIRSTSAASKFAEVTFTHESWAEINREMDTRYADKRIIGWYHSHPDFGIFLSERDCFIHEHFFSGPGQVAYVVDPVRDLEGVFSWQGGKPASMSHFWVGPQIHTVQASVRHDVRAMTRDAAVPASADVAATETPVLESPLSTSTTLLAWICLFLLGYGCAGYRTRAEQQLLAEGAVAHYGLMKIVKLDLEADVARVRQSLRTIESELNKLPKAADKLSAADAEKVDKQRQVLGDSLVMAERSLEKIQQDYALTPDERASYLRLYAEKQAEVNRILNGQSPAGPAAATTNDDPKATAPPAPVPQPKLPSESALADPSPSDANDTQPTAAK